MLNGNYKDFLEKLNLGEELLFEFNSFEYFIQGWIEDNKARMVLDKYSNVSFSGYYWECTCDTMRECADKFLHSELWDGNTFQEIQNEVIWKD